MRPTTTARVTISSSAVTSNVNIDNDPVGVTLSGPTDAPSTAGTQYVTATGSAGPSGVSGIGCSVDGSPSQWYPQASVQVPVAGVGVHRVTCYSANNARDASGNVATSAPQSWTLSIRQPTVAGIGFAKHVDSLLCRRVTKRVKVPARWVTVRRHHRRVRVRRRARTKVERVMRCHARVVRRRVAVWVTVRRHGKLVRVKRHRWIRVPLLPHVVMHSTKRVGHGRRTSVSGWLGMPDGTALGGQVVRVLTAPDNGLGHFTQAAVATTAANGSWSARLPAGPSRLVEAYYAGAADARAERLGAGARGRAGEGEAAQHLPTARRVGRHGADRRPARRRLPAARRRARAPADRVGFVVFDLRSAGARDRQRPVLDDLHVRRRAGEQLPAILVPAGLPADGVISIFAERLGEAIRARRRPSVDPAAAASPSPAPPASQAMSESIKGAGRWR